MTFVVVNRLIGVRGVLMVVVLGEDEGERGMERWRGWEQR
jgi:hypothetical protein